MAPEPQSDAEVRAQDQERVGADAVERRAISVGNVIRNRRHSEGDVPRAESRGVYRDLNGRRRIVGAGQRIPDGWDRLEAASIEDRTAATPTVQDESGNDGEGGATRKRSSKK